jgi:hypothetical protein
MPRKANVIPSDRLYAHIPRDLLVKLNLHLWSELENRVPYGAHSTWIAERIRDYFEYRSLDLAPFGFPPGFFVSGPEEVINQLRTRLQGA